MTLTLVLSDLHASSGRNPVSGKYSPLEDFYGDAALARFLAHYQNQDAGAHLVFNGDSFDFTQVVELPPPREAFELTGQSPLDRDRRKYGLGHSPAESAWKLGRIAAGHPRLFAALGEWVKHGHHIHFVIGNHDFELRYPVVQKRLVRLIAQTDPALERDEVQPLIHFHDWYFYQPEQHLYAEHGGQYEPLANIVDGKLPACYFNNRYLFNRLEMRTPEADNIYPFSRYIAWLISTDTLPTLSILLRQMPDFVRAKRATSQKLPLALPSDPRLPERAEGELRQAVADQHSLIKSTTYSTSMFTAIAILLGAAAHLSPLFTVILALTGHPLLAIMTLAAWPIAHVASASLIYSHLHVSLTTGGEFLHQVARQIAPALADSDINTITFGHTHQADIAQLPGGMSYFNTATWVPILASDTRLDAQKQTNLFVEVQNGHSRLLRWDDSTGQPEEPAIIDRTCRSPRQTARRPMR